MAFKKRHLLYGAGIALVSAAVITSPAMPFAAALLFTSFATFCLMGLAFGLQSLHRHARHTRHHRDDGVRLHHRVRVRPAPRSWFGLAHLFAPRAHVVRRPQVHRVHTRSNPSHSFVPAWITHGFNTHRAANSTHIRRGTGAAHHTSFRNNSNGPAHTTIRRR